MATQPLLASTYDVAIVGGRVVDPRQGIDAHYDLLISGGKVAALTNGSYRAATVIDATGTVVAPGFIDLLSDNSQDPQETYLTTEKYKITDGVTTALQLHGGVSSAGKYEQAMGSLAHHTNHGVSTKVMRIRKKTASVSKRLKLVERSLKQGSLGVSHSLEYQPTPFRETVRYAKLAAKWDVPFFLHLRHSSEEKELRGLDEGLRITEATGCHLHIDHLHSTGATWHMEEAIDLINRAITGGSRITACVYPYTFWATYLQSKRFGPGWRQRYGIDFEDLRVVGTGEGLTRKTFEKYRKRTWTLVAVPAGAMSLQDTLLPALRQPWMAIASDGGIEKDPVANNHPRGAGCFSTAIRLALDNDIPLTDVLRKMTDLPASILRGRSDQMKRRGSLRVGDAADVVVFDPNKVDGKATVEMPNAQSVGIAHVLVSGKVAYGNGALAQPGGGVLVKGNLTIA